MNKAIKILLNNSGSSIYRIGKVVGLCPATIWNYLSGNLVKPNPEYVEKIAHALGISPEELLRLTRISDDEITPEVLHKVILSLTQNDTRDGSGKEKMQSSP